MKKVKEVSLPMMKVAYSRWDNSYDDCVMYDPANVFKLDLMHLCEVQKNSSNYWIIREDITKSDKTIKITGETRWSTWDIRRYYETAEFPEYEGWTHVIVSKLLYPSWILMRPSKWSINTAAGTREGFVIKNKVSISELFEDPIKVSRILGNQIVVLVNYKTDKAKVFMRYAPDAVFESSLAKYMVEVASLIEAERAKFQAYERRQAIRKSLEQEALERQASVYSDYMNRFHSNDDLVFSSIDGIGWNEYDSSDISAAIRDAGYELPYIEGLWEG